MRISLAVLVALLSCFSLKVWAKKQEQTLRVVTDAWPPFRLVNQDGSLYGLDIEILDELSRRTGIKFKYRLAPWARGLAALKNGQADLMTGLAKSSDREQYTQYTKESYHTCAPRFYVLEDDINLLNSYKDLENFRTGYVSHSIYFEPFDSDKNLNKVAVDSENQLLEMLVRRRIQAFVGEDCQVDYDLKAFYGASQIVKANYRPKIKTALYFGFSKHNDLDKEKQSIDRALVKMRENGWLEQTINRYRLMLN